MSLVKICGLMNKEDTAFCCQAGVSFLGFIVEYPAYVPWNLTQEKAAALMKSMSGKSLSCIVTGGEPGNILRLAGNLKPDFIQLHYKETFEETLFLSKELKKLGIQTIKALPVDAGGKCEMAEFETPGEAAEALSKTDVSMLLIDSRSGANPTKSQKLNLTFYQEAAAASTKPVLLAGGIHTGNLPAILEAVNPFAVDILTGAETAPGVKNYLEIQAICSLCSKN